jgi:hypothetical protein
MFSEEQGCQIIYFGYRGIMSPNQMSPDRMSLLQYPAQCHPADCHLCRMSPIELTTPNLT